MKTLTYLTLTLLLALPCLGQTGRPVLPDGRIVLHDSTVDGSITHTRTERFSTGRWEYRGPVLGAFSEGGDGQYTGGLQVTVPFECVSTLVHDLKLGGKVIYDQARGTEATIAAIMRRNPASFLAQDGGTPAPLPADEAERLANAQAEGPGFWSRPSTYATGLGAGLAAWVLQDQLSGGSDGKGTTVAIEGNGNAVSTGRGNASADNSSTSHPTTFLPAP